MLGSRVKLTNLTQRYIGNALRTWGLGLDGVLVVVVSKMSFFIDEECSFFYKGNR